MRPVAARGAGGLRSWPVSPTDPTDPFPPAARGEGVDAPSAAGGARLTHRRVLLWAAVVGLVGGLLATGYYALLSGGMWLVWRVGGGISPEDLSFWPRWNPYVPVVTTAGGLVVGLCLKWLGVPGEIAAVVDNIHLRHGRLDARQTPSMIAASLASIVAGGSAGPEAPLVQIIGSLGSLLGDRLKLRGEHVRTLTFCGMGAALGAFFGAPLGGAIFALEIPHRRGIEYYEALLPALISAVLAFLVFRGLVGYEHLLFRLPGDTELSLDKVAWGVVFGAVGAGVAGVFAACFNAVGRLTRRFEHHHVALATAAGLAIGGLAMLCPMSLFWGEFQIAGVVGGGAALRADHGLAAAAGLLLGLALVKMLAVGLTLHGGFRGGFIFPLLFIGACVGTALSLALGAAVPGVPAAVVIVSVMAATNVAVTKTPISTSLILVTLTGTSILPVTLAASLTGLLLSPRLNLIRTQRTRGDSRRPAAIPPPPAPAVVTLKSWSNSSAGSPPASSSPPSARRSSSSGGTTPARA